MWSPWIGSVGDGGEQLVGAAVEQLGAEPRTPTAAGAVLVAPGPQPAREVMEGVLARDAHGAVRLVGGPGRLGDGVVDDDLGGGDLEAAIARRGRADGDIGGHGG